MKKERRDTLMTAVEGTKEISVLCSEIAINLARLLEFTEEERDIKIINELMGKTSKITKHCVCIAAICKTVADGKSGVKSVGKTIRKITNGEIKMINE